MKIKTIDRSTKKPLKNLRIQLQVKGKDSGFLTLTSDMEGAIMLDEKYKGQQIALANAGNQADWITATDGATLLVASTPTHGAQGHGGKEKNKETWK